MRVVIYDAEDMEPITVIKLDGRWADQLQRDRELVVAVFPPLRLGTPNDELDLNRAVQMSRCRLRFEPIMKGGKLMMWLCTTMDGESALLLRSVFLPGQQSAIGREREDAFMQGLMMAMDGR